MKIFIKFNLNTICSHFLNEKLEGLDLDYQAVSLSEININETLDNTKFKSIKDELHHFGFEIIENQKGILVEKIKEAITEMISIDNQHINIKKSVYLSEKLRHSYGYLSNVFSETTYISIENFIILQKIERVKQLLIANELSLTQIAFLLNYSSVSHLSTQFKNTTGITPSSFQRIIQKRRANQTIS